MSRSTRTDDGLGLIEVIIAMVLLAVLALAVLPLLISAMGLSVDNRSSVVATNLANDRIAEIRSVYSTGSHDSECTKLVDFKEDVLDAHHSSMTVATDLGVYADPIECPSGETAYPMTVPITVHVFDGGKSMATVSTKVMVAKR